MAKRKKRSGGKQGPRRRSPKLRVAVQGALDLAGEGQTDEALSILSGLADAHPRSREVLAALLEVSTDVRYWPFLARYGERLLPLVTGEERAETLHNLAVAYAELDFPALTWQTAREIVTRHPDYEDTARFARLAQQIEPALAEQAEHLISGRRLPPEQERELLVQYDRLRLYLATGQFQEALAVGKALKEKLPQSVTVLNNLSLVQFMLDHRQQAIATSREVLAQAPDNFNALGNLTRYYFLTAQFEEAEEVADRLRHARSDSPDLEAKQAEALAFLGDDEGVRDAYRRARRRGTDASPLLLHLAATAHFRLGDEKTAWRLWRQTVRDYPSFSMAQACLDERFTPPGEREVPWYWTISYWFPSAFRDELQQALGAPGRSKSEAVARANTQALLARYPYLTRLFPHVLERGSPEARTFVVALLQTVDRPDLAGVLRDFALGPYGNDELRMQVVEYLIDEHPQVLPDDRVVTMWLRGRQQEVSLIGYEIYTEPEPDPAIPEEILDRCEEVVWALSEGEAAEAERMVLEILERKSDFPLPYNQLAVAYEMQERREEARELLHAVHQRFPDYLFARTGLARIYCTEERVDAAKALLAPLMGRQRLHLSEFRSLAQAQLDVLLSEGKVDAARTWFDMLSEIDEDNPQLSYWQKRLEFMDSLGGVLQKMVRRRPGDKKGH